MYIHRSVYNESIFRKLKNGLKSRGRHFEYPQGECAKYNIYSGYPEFGDFTYLQSLDIPEKNCNISCHILFAVKVDGESDVNPGYINRVTRQDPGLTSLPQRHFQPTRYIAIFLRRIQFLMNYLFF